MSRVVRVSKIGRGHGDAAMRRVNEAPRAGVNADVIDAVLTQAEEHQVAGQQLRERHRLRGALLGRRGARDAEAHALVRIERKPAAVKAAKIRTAERVGRADERRGRARNGRARRSPVPALPGS